MELDFSVITPYLNLIPAALAITLKIGFASFVAAVILAIIVGSLRTRKLPWIFRFLLAAYVEFFRGTPLLVQLFLFYYALPAFGLKIDALSASIITMGLNSGAYLSEVVRASIMSIDEGQYEAAEMLGYSPMQTTIHIILPQALRIAVPPFMNGLSSIIKETSLVSVLPLVELMKLSNQIYAKTYHPFECYITAAIIYFVICYALTFFAKWLERRLSVWVH